MFSKSANHQIYYTYQDASDKYLVYNGEKYSFSSLTNIFSHEVMELLHLSRSFAFILPWLDIKANHLDFKSTDTLVLKHFPPTLESYNNLKHGNKKWAMLKTNLDSINSVKNETFLSLATALGLFYGDQTISKQAFDIVEHMLTNIEDIDLRELCRPHCHIDSLYHYDCEFTKWFINEYQKDHFNVDDITPYIKRAYLESKQIKQFAIKLRNQKIKKLYRLIKQKNAAGEVDPLEQTLLIDLQANLKAPFTTKEIEIYFHNHQFYIRTGNEALKDIVDYLPEGFDQEKFDQIQDLYQVSLTSEPKLMPFVKDTTDGQYHYEWLEASDPRNFSAGYAVDCCAIVDDAAELLLKSTLVAPEVQNLIITDSNNRIVAKATAFYNHDQQYLLFNTIHIKGKQLNYELIYKKLIQAINDTRQLMEQLEIPISLITIGMLRGELINRFKEEKHPIITDDLPANYDFYPYRGEANDINAGQAVLYEHSRKRQLTV